MPTTLGMIGAQAAGAGMGLMLQGQADRRQLKQQDALNKQAIEQEQRLTEFNMQKQLEMWKATNYGPQMAELKKAGLNPGLIYGMSGGGGATTNINPGKVQAGGAPAGGREIQDAVGMGMQMQILKAQKENIEADTANKIASNPNIPKEGKKLDIEIESLTQGIQNQKAVEALTRAETALKELETRFGEYTYENRATIINLTASKLIEEVQIMENESEISDATKYEKIKMITAQLNNILSDTLNKQKNTAKSQAEINKIDAEIKFIQQTLNIRSFDENMANKGYSPDTGRLPKLFFNMLEKLKDGINNHRR